MFLFAQYPKKQTWRIFSKVVFCEKTCLLIHSVYAVLMIEPRRYLIRHFVFLDRTEYAYSSLATCSMFESSPLQARMFIKIRSLFKAFCYSFKVCGSMPFDDSNIKRMVKDQMEKRVCFPKSKKVTDDCRELIHKILEVNGKKRLTIPQILDHGWVRWAKTSYNLLLAFQINN